MRLSFQVNQVNSKFKITQINNFKLLKIEHSISDKMKNIVFKSKQKRKLFLIMKKCLMLKSSIILSYHYQN